MHVYLNKYIYIYIYIYVRVWQHLSRLAFMAEALEPFQAAPFASRLNRYTNYIP